jgi:TonB family protein
MKISSINFILICSIILWGCSSQKPFTKIDKEPELIKKTALTSFSGNFTDKNFELKTRLFISEEGNVSNVELLNSSGDKEWDVKAINRIKEWKYNPAILEGKPISIWFLQSIKITVFEKFKFHLAEIKCKSLLESDTIYSKIKSGVDFGSLARQYSISESSKKSGDLGLVDIQLFPEFVQSILNELKISESSKPLKVDDSYYIYKKMEIENP